MTQTIIKDYLVYIPYHDNTPQRMRLRITDAKNIDEVLFQIERQLIEDQSSQVKKPLEPDTYMMLLLDGHDHALLPIENAAFEVIANCTSILLQPRPIPQTAPMPIDDSESVTALVKDACSSTGSDDCAPSKEVREESFQEQSVDATTSTMLHVVESIIAYLVSHSIGPESVRHMSEHKWLSLLEHAMERDHVDRSQLNPKVIEAFRDSVMAAFHHNEQPQCTVNS